MADTKISALTALTGANTAPNDLLAIVDTSAVTTKSITRQELQTFNLGTITTDIKVLDLSATWNAAGVTFTGLKFNVTDTASAAASLLLDLQVGGSSRASINKNGTITGRSGAATTPGIALSDSTGMGLSHMSGIGGMGFTDQGFTRAAVSGVNGEFGVGSSGSYNFGSSTNAPANNFDVRLFRDAANTLALRNGTNAQTFNSYRSYTDASNYSRLTSKWNTTTAVIHAEGLGTGTDGNIAFNDAALATTATVGYVMIPSCAGAPTGVPADIPTGQVALHFDSTNNKLYVYDGGWLSTAALT